ncbi:DUF6892 domain-containing protein [Microbulbifer aggregans]|uniref:DUF6892 domain-containing protein n=1 Tax=Microbulbifer aggregans TaxID=1769779 RepID=UPI001CFD2ABE|nr:hypothetical protein [Microbulbifer aggregans]
MSTHSFNELTAPIDGPNKDLNFALKTGSKKVSSVLTKLTQNATQLAPNDACIIVIQLLVYTAQIHLADKKSNQLLATIGKFILKACRNESVANLVIQQWLYRLYVVEYTNPAQCQAAAQWLMLFNQSDGSASSPEPLQKAFDAAHGALNEVQKKIANICHEQKVFQDKSGEQSGFALLELFTNTCFYHSSTCPPNYENWVIEAVEHNINFGNGLTLAVLQRSQNRARVAAKLIDKYVRASSVIDNVEYNLGGMSWGLFSDLFDIESYSAKQANNVVDCMVENSTAKQWTTEQAIFASKHLLAVNEVAQCRRLLTKSKAAKKLATLLVEIHGDAPALQVLKVLLAGNTKPKYKLPTGGETQFSDINVKLIVLNELMYVQQSLKPAFDIRQFAKEYDHREIAVAGYDIIPEALAYMRGIHIPQTLLNSITEISYDASDEIYGQLMPYWDGEDDDFKPTSLADLDKLPNVKSIGGLDEGREA